eukprot:COSAG02_NODE_651_length_18910_cov_12.561639_5_plen_120_part_00
MTFFSQLMNPVVFTLSRMYVNNFENSVDELQEFCTAVQLYYRYRYRYRRAEYNESILTLNAWLLVTAGSRNRYYPQPHLAQGSARIFGTSERYSLRYLGTDSAMGDGLGVGAPHCRIRV